jgi:hypothetical protein
MGRILMMAASMRGGVAESELRGLAEIEIRTIDRTSV